MNEKAVSREEYVELTKSAAEVKELVVDKFDKIDEVLKTAQEEISAFGSANESTVEKLDAIRGEYDGLCDRLLSLEQAGAGGISASEKAFNLGEDFAANDAVLAMCEGKNNSARVMYEKTAIINATGQNQPLVAADRLPGIAALPNRVLTIRDVLPVETTDSNLVEFTRESGYTNNAGPTVSGSPEQYENVTKPESAITFSLESEPVITLAHFIPASRQVMSDSAALAGHINNRLMYGLKLKEETQILSGTGGNHQLNGLVTQATAYAPGDSPNATNEITIVRDAIRQAHLSEYVPDFLVLNPQDWYDIETRTVGSGDDRYVVGDPNSLMANRLWGLPVVVTNSISSGAFLIGSSAGCVLKDREQASVEMSREDSDNFRKNMVTVLAEERLALCVYRTEAFITGAL